jgi:hypothetical protein
MFGITLPIYIIIYSILFLPSNGSKKNTKNKNKEKRVRERERE